MSPWVKKGAASRRGGPGRRSGRRAGGRHSLEVSERPYTVNTKRDTKMPKSKDPGLPFAPTYVMPSRRARTRTFAPKTA